MAYKQVFLDLDGVVIDWLGGVIKYFGLSISEFDVRSYGQIEQIAKEEKGLTRNQFWKQQGKEFWTNLQMYPWAHDLLKMLAPFRPVILTAPTLNNAGWRQEWIRRNMPNYFDEKRYLIGPAKWSVAHTNAILIDDKPKNLEEFYQAGGTTLTFPQPWNSIPEEAWMKEGRWELFRKNWEYGVSMGYVEQQ